MNVKVKMKFGFESQTYEAPRAESVEMRNEGLLCASVTTELNESFEEEVITGTWGN